MCLNKLTAEGGMDRVALDGPKAQEIAAEVLGEAEVFVHSTSGPDGPWHLGYTEVKRDWNVIRVMDPDGDYHHVNVEDIDDKQDLLNYVEKVEQTWRALL